MHDMQFKTYLGKSETRTDTVWPVLASGMAATLDAAHPAGAAAVLPPLWHWTLFQDWEPAANLGPDGHPKRGGFLPPAHDLPRRMWAGGRMSFPGELRVGAAVTRTSTITSIETKTGGSGTLLFVTVRHEIAGPDGPAVVEEHDIVYRGSEGRAVKPASPAPPPPTGAVERVVVPDAVMLFRYSALTGNSHRIHYDLAYATRDEGYPGLVVHGPLQATLLAGLATQAAGDAKLRGFSFRARRPAFHDRPLRLIAVPAGATMRVESRDDTDAVCMSGEATFG